MSQESTIMLNAKIAPGDKDWHRGYITDLDSHGVTINSRHDWRGTSTLYPWHQVQKIEQG